MKKVLLTSLSSLLVVSAASAMDFSPYIALRGGYNMTSAAFSNAETTDGNGFLIGASIGTELYKNTVMGLRAEIEYNYITSYDMDGSDATNSTILANVFADFDTATTLTPYVSLGIGYGWTTITINTVLGDIDMDDSNMAWQLGAGISYALLDNMKLDLGYRYLNSTNFETPIANTELDIESHQIYLGARLTF